MVRCCAPYAREKEKKIKHIRHRLTLLLGMSTPYRILTAQVYRFLTNPTMSCTCYQCILEPIRQHEARLRNERHDFNSQLSQLSYTRKGRASRNLGVEQAVLVPARVEELGRSLELTEQAVEETAISSHQSQI